MTKSDLKDGMIVEIKNGYTYLIHIHHEKALGVFGTEGSMSINSWDDDLTCIHIRELDIIAVYSVTRDVCNLCERNKLSYCECIWRREEPKTLEERVEIMEQNIKTIMDTLEELK